MTTNTGGPAFPAPAGRLTPITDQGMTLRDYFAAKAMHARLTTYQGTWYGGVAEEAYAIADAMLKARQT